MSVHTHISRLSVEEKIEYWITQQEGDPYEGGPGALDELYEFIVAGIADGKIDDPADVCNYVRHRIQTYWEE